MFGAIVALQRIGYFTLALPKVLNMLAMNKINSFKMLLALVFYKRDNLIVVIIYGKIESEPTVCVGVNQTWECLFSGKYNVVFGELICDQMFSHREFSASTALVASTSQCPTPNINVVATYALTFPSNMCSIVIPDRFYGC